jgi:hypothetical protein
MKKSLSLLLLVASIISSCSKKNDGYVKPITPLSNAIDTKYISDGGDGLLEVAFTEYKPGSDCDKAVFDAAIQTVHGNTGINLVIIHGATLTMYFDRSSNVQPAKMYLTSGSNLYKSVNQNWEWKGYLTISKQNTFLTKEQFESAINITVGQVNTGDVAQVTDKFVADDSMYIEYALTKSNPAYSQAIYYDVQANAPVTLKSQLKINCLIPDFIYPQSTVEIELPPRLPAPEQKDLGNGVTSYSQRIDASDATESLSYYIAHRYFLEKFYPTVK